MRFFYFFMLVLWSFSIAYGQSFLDFGSAKSETIHQMIENGEGETVAIGTTSSATKTGKDVYFSISDKSGEKRVEKNIGRAGDEEGLSLIQSFDGTYVLIGYTTQQKQKKGWIINVDNNGQVIWDKVVNTSGESQLKEVVQLEDGSLWAVGEQGQQISLFHFEENGEPIQNIPIAGIKGTSSALIKLANGNLVISGQEQLDKAQQVFLLEASTIGDILWKQTFPIENIAVSEDCIQTFDGGFILVGATNDPKLREEIAILKINPERQTVWAKTFGGKGYVDRATALIQLPNEDIMVTGITTSHKKGAKKGDCWLHRINAKNGEPIWEQAKNFGGDNHDEGNSILRLRDGSIRLGGQIWSKGNKKNPDLVIPFKPIQSEGIKGNAKLTLEFIQIKEANNNTYLDAGERGYIQYQLTNVSTIDAYNIVGGITTKYKVKGFSFPSKVYVDRIPAGQSKLVSIPLAANEKVRSGMNKLIGHFKATNSQESISETILVESKKKPIPQLEFVLEPLLSDNIHYFDSPTKLVLKLVNKGNATAEQFTCKIRFPAQLRTDNQEEEIISISSLLPNQEQAISLDFTISPNYVKDNFAINCLVYDKDYQYQSEAVFNKQITVPISLSDAASFTKAVWMQPSPNSQSIVQDSVILIKVKAVSTQPIPKSSFQAFLNRQPITAPVNENQTKVFSTNNLYGDSLILDTTKSRYTYTFIEKVHLKKGQNQINVQVKNTAGEDQTSTIAVNYKPVKPTLHIVSIGVPFDDLEFTDSDAASIKENFDQQKGLTYAQNLGISELLNTPANTKCGEIRKALEGLKTYARINTIKSDDVLVLFISSHGFFDEDSQQFRIHGSDYDNVYPKNTSVAFRDDLLENLAAIPCRKLLFFDACFSGNTIQDLEAIEAIPNLEMLLSSSLNEQSYEDKKWGHGAFTKAILEFFKKAKTNTANIELTIEDVYHYVKKRVPELVKNKKPKTTRSQTPILIRSKGAVAAPIFKVMD